MSDEKKNSKTRVKVYELNEDGEWADQGTGNIKFVNHDGQSVVVVHSEVDQSILLESVVNSTDDESYQRQGDTIVSWTDFATKKDVAISFAEGSGCQIFWVQLCKIRGLDSNEPAPPPPVVEAVRPDTPPYPLTIENFPQLVSFFSKIMPYMKNEITTFISKNGYLKHLLDFFLQLEATGDIERLRQMFFVFRALVSLNDSSLIDQLMNDSNYLSVFGVFEYDPDLASQQFPKQNYREFWEKSVKFNQIVVIKDQVTLGRIHQNFRVQYLKDILSSVLDDPTIGVLNNMLFFNNVEILQQIQNSDSYLPGIFSQLNEVRREDDIAKAEEKQKRILLLLQEMFEMTKSLRLNLRTNFFKALYGQGLFSHLNSALHNSHLKCRSAVISILSICYAQDPSYMRTFLIDQPRLALFDDLISRVQKEPDHALKAQIVDFIHSLFEADSIEQAQEKHEFLNIFYENFMDKLVNFMSPNTYSVEYTSQQIADTQNYVCELLSFFVTLHTYRIKYFIVKNETLNFMCNLVTKCEKYVALSIIRFIRVCVGQKLECYSKSLIRNNSFVPIVQLFKENELKDNLINSAIVELFDYIQKEKIPYLFEYISSTFEAEFKNISYVSTFKSYWPAESDKNEAKDKDSEVEYFKKYQSNVSGTIVEYLSGNPSFLLQ